MRSPSGIAVWRASAFDATAQRVYEAPGLGGTFANLATIPCGAPAAYGKAFQFGRLRASARSPDCSCAIRDRHSRIPQALNPGYRAVRETMTMLNHTMTSH